MENKRWLHRTQCDNDGDTASSCKLNRFETTKLRGFSLEFYLPKDEVRRHFNCSTLEGAELEDQGEIGTKLTHWEKRVFEVENHNF